CMNVVYRSDVDTAIASCGWRAPTAASSGIWQSTNASAASPTWTHILGAPTSPATQVLANMGRISLAIAPSHQATVYALISCYGTCGSFSDGLLAVYRSTDGGATWASQYTSTLNSTTAITNYDLLLSNPIYARYKTCYGA